MADDLVFTDSVLAEIATRLAALPPERGGAVIEAGRIFHSLVEDDDGSYTGSSWDISPALTTLVNQVEAAGGGRFAATVHTHPAGVPDPSGQDLRATAHMLDENPHLDELGIFIVTHGSPRPTDLPIGERHRMSIHVARRGPDGTCRVACRRGRVVPVGEHLRCAGITEPVLGLLSWQGTERLAVRCADMRRPVLLFSPDYPRSAPILLDVADDHALVERKPRLWAAALDPGSQLRSLLLEPDEDAADVLARVAPLIGRLNHRKVLAVGLGSVGTVLLEELARAGVGYFVLVDHDRVQASDLSRQRYESRHVGQLKTVAARELLESIAPLCSCEGRPNTIAELDAELTDLCAGADLVVAATDHPSEQALLSHHAYAAGTPLLSAALYRRAAAGEVVLTVPAADTPCWSCSIGGSPIAHRGEKDYGTGQLKGEVALGPSIHTVAVLAAGLAIGLLAGPDTPAGRPVAELLASGRTTGIIATTPRWDFFPEVFRGLEGHQWAPQSVWMKPSRDLTCPICGTNRQPPPQKLGTALRRKLTQLRTHEGRVVTWAER